MVESCSILPGSFVSQENLAKFEVCLAEERTKLLEKRKNERKQKRKMEAAAAKQAEEENQGRYRQTDF